MEGSFKASTLAEGLPYLLAKYIKINKSVLKSTLSERLSYEGGNHESNLQIIHNPKINQLQKYDLMIGN